MVQVFFLILAVDIGDKNLHQHNDGYEMLWEERIHQSLTENFPYGSAVLKFFKSAWLCAPFFFLPDNLKQ